MATHSSILAWRIPMDRGPWRTAVPGVMELDTTELLSSQSGFFKKMSSCLIHIRVDVLTTALLLFGGCG